MKSMKKKVVIMLLLASLALSAACAKTDAPEKKEAPEKKVEQESVLPKDAVVMSEAFPKFQGKDFDGNAVDESLFSKNEATLLNFWFNGCAACVNEMPALQKFHEKLSEKGAELVGVNVQARESQEALDEAKDILKKQGVKYRNIMIEGGNEAEAYLAQIFSFPTTVLVDKEGNIIGEPILGNLEDEKRQEEILKLIDDLKAGKMPSEDKISSDESAETDPAAALFAKENEIFAANQEIWNKVFSKIQKDQVQANETPYPEFLKSQIEAAKDSFSKEELEILDKDLEAIAEIEKEIEALAPTAQ